MSCINREEAIRLIMEYQGGAMDKPTVKKILEGMCGVEICEDTISRQAAIDIGRNATVDTNPMHFEAHQKFIQFMDDAEISSFGRWQWSNGFNTALTAIGIDLKKLPPAQPEIIRCKDCKHYEIWQLKSDYTDDKRYKPSVCVVGCYAVHRSEDWFCADAERRTDE